MSRMPVSLRQATPTDAPFLVELWSDLLRRADRQDQAADVEILVKACAASAEQRLVVAEYAGEPAGAVLLKVDTLSPLNPEPALQVMAPHVTAGFRRRGVGRTLMDAAVTWAEELGIGHVVTAAASSSRNGNRFMARLSLGPQAVLRVATTHSVRTKLTAQRPASQRNATRPALGQVVAARRSLRRARQPVQHPQRS